MKNIHVLPTDKPSRLYYNKNGRITFSLCETKKENTPLKILVGLSVGNMCIFFISNEYKLVIYLQFFLNLLSSIDIETL